LYSSSCPISARDVVFHVDEYGITLLHTALEKDVAYADFKLLLRIASGDNSREFAQCVNKIGWTPLHYASYFSNSVEVMQILIRQHPPSLTLQGKRLATPGSLVGEWKTDRSNHAAIVQLLDKCTEAFVADDMATLRKLCVTNSELCRYTTLACLARAAKDEDAFLEYADGQERRRGELNVAIGLRAHLRCSDAWMLILGFI
jgi:hypothetical protein